MRKDTLFHKPQPPGPTPSLGPSPAAEAEGAGGEAGVSGSLDDVRDSARPSRGQGLTEGPLGPPPVSAVWTPTPPALQQPSLLLEHSQDLLAALAGPARRSAVLVGLALLRAPPAGPVFQVRTRRVGDPRCLPAERLAQRLASLLPSATRAAPAFGQGERCPSGLCADTVGLSALDTHRGPEPLGPVNSMPGFSEERKPLATAVPARTVTRGCFSHGKELPRASRV